MSSQAVFTKRRPCFQHSIHGLYVLTHVNVITVTGIGIVVTFIFKSWGTNKNLPVPKKSELVSIESRLLGYTDFQQSAMHLFMLFLFLFGLILRQDFM